MRTPWPQLEQIPLDPTADDWRALTARVTDFLYEELSSLGQNSVLQTNTSTPDSAPDLESYLRQLFTPGFNAAHPGFMGYIPGGGLVSSALADWIIKTINRYGTAEFAAPKLANLEYEVLQTFARWVGYNDGFAGVLTTGGSLANFTALVTARRAMLPEQFLQGVIYCSDQTHHSVMKAANLAGFSSRNLRIVESDAFYRIRLDQLRETIAADRAKGMTPFLLVGSAGTTNTGAVDPIPAMAQIAAAEHLWFHVDAAYGGAFLLTKRGQRLLSGIDEADSVTLDPHKGLFLPYGTGGILVKDKARLIEAHELRGDYLPDLDYDRAHLDPFSLSVELSREHRGLKVALPLMLHGEAAFSAALDEKLDLANFAHQALLASDRFEVLNAPELSTFAFRLKHAVADQANRALMERVNAAGLVYLSGTLLDDRFALRVSILSHRTHKSEVVALLNELERHASVLEKNGVEALR